MSFTQQLGCVCIRKTVSAWFSAVYKLLPFLVYLWWYIGNGELNSLLCKEGS